MAKHATEGLSASLVQACRLGLYRPRFKSGQPHHNNGGPIFGLQYFLLLNDIGIAELSDAFEIGFLSFWASWTAVAEGARQLVFVNLR
jgi:hypothetical protein